MNQRLRAAKYTGKILSVANECVNNLILAIKNDLDRTYRISKPYVTELRSGCGVISCCRLFREQCSHLITA